MRLRFETLKQKEFWATYESYNGLKRWGIGMAQPSYPWPESSTSWAAPRCSTSPRSYWDAVVKDYVRQMVGADLVFDVPADIVKANEQLKIPQDVTV